MFTPAELVNILSCCSQECIYCLYFLSLKNIVSGISDDIMPGVITDLSSNSLTDASPRGGTTSRLAARSSPRLLPLHCPPMRGVAPSRQPQGPAGTPSPSSGLGPHPHLPHQLPAGAQVLASCTVFLGLPLTLPPGCGVAELRVLG